MRDPDLAIDMGSATTRLFVPGAVLVEVPTRDPLTGKEVVAHGVVVDEDAATRLAQRLLGRPHPLSAAGPRVLASCPLHLDCAWPRLRDALRRAGAVDVEMIRSTVAAAAGAGLDVTSRFAEMLVDVGAGLTEVAVFRDGAVLHAGTIPMGARDLSTSPARRLADHDGSAIPPSVLAEHVASIWKSLPEDVQVEVIESGLVLTGGGAEMPELVQAIRQATRLEVRVAEQPSLAVIRGLAWLGVRARVA